jgi:hypothetical protein
MMDQARVYNNLGNLHRDAGRWNDAATAYIHALELYTELIMGTTPPERPPAKSQPSQGNFLIPPQRTLAAIK